MTTPDHPPRATKQSSTFAMDCSVTITIDAPPERVWALLTNAGDMPRWSSTITSIEGTIALGEKLALRVPATPKRTFTPKVTALETARRMVWSDGMAPMFKGVRTFDLEPRHGGTAFTMHERFAGIMLPMIRGSLPDFGPVFEAYAADLKREAEK